MIAMMPKFIALPFLLALALSVPAHAADPLPDLAEARSLADQARQLRVQAESEFRQAEPLCYERFLVNRCLSEARALRLERIREARAMDIESRRIELAHKRLEIEAATLPESVVSTEGVIPAQTAIPEPGADSATLYLRSQREAQRLEAEAQRQRSLAQSDADQAESRQRAEESAARRAERAERDRVRYDDRRQ